MYITIQAGSALQAMIGWAIVLSSPSYVEVLHRQNS